MSVKQNNLTLLYVYTLVPLLREPLVRPSLLAAMMAPKHLHTSPSQGHLAVNHQGKWECMSHECCVMFGVPN